MSTVKRAILATFGVVAGLAILIVIGYLVLAPFAAEGRRFEEDRNAVRYRWTEQQRTEYRAAATRLGTKSTVADCQVDEWAKRGYTFSTFSSAPSSDLISVVGTCTGR
jgi:hypothetical protein